MSYCREHEQSAIGIPMVSVAKRQVGKGGEAEAIVKVDR